MAAETPPGWAECLSVPKEQGLLADNHLFLVKTNAYVFYSFVPAGKLRHGRLVALSDISSGKNPNLCPHHPQPLRPSSGLTPLLPVAGNPPTRGSLGIETPSKGRHAVVKVKSIAAEM